MTQQLPHTPGTLSNSIWSVASDVPSEDVKSGYIVGANNLTGNAIAFNGSTITVGKSQGDPVIGLEAVIQRPNSNQKSRTVVLETGINGRIRKSRLRIFTAPQAPNLDINACGFINGLPPALDNFPKPKNEPDPLPPEEELIEELEEEEIPKDPLNPTPEPEIVDTPIGCSIVDDSQWYLREPDNLRCPLATSSAGFVDFGREDGKIWIHCKGKGRPVGDGCPVDSSTYGWSCVDGVCTRVLGGRFATQSECENAGCFPTTYNCTDQGCVPVFDGSGSFSTLQQCQSSCSGRPTPPVQCGLSTITYVIRSNIWSFTDRFTCVTDIPHTAITYNGLFTRTLDSLISEGNPVYQGIYRTTELCDQAEDISSTLNSSNSYFVLSFSSLEGTFYILPDGLLFNTFTVSVTNLNIVANCPQTNIQFDVFRYNDSTGQITSPNDPSPNCGNIDRTGVVYLQELTGTTDSSIPRYYPTNPAQSCAEQNPVGDFYLGSEGLEPDAATGFPPDTWSGALFSSDQGNFMIVYAYNPAFISANHVITPL